VPRRRHLVSCPNLFSVLLALRLATAQGNCPSNDCSSCPCGYSSNYVDVGSACSQFSGWDQGCCQCIANHESGGNVIFSLLSFFNPFSFSFHVPSDSFIFKRLQVTSTPPTRTTMAATTLVSGRSMTRTGVSGTLWPPYKMKFMIESLLTSRFLAQQLWR
jgi:hypothetical protein